MKGNVERLNSGIAELTSKLYHLQMVKNPLVSIFSPDLLPTLHISFLFQLGLSLSLGNQYAELWTNNLM